jgi:hypothetical protein
MDNAALIQVLVAGWSLGACVAGVGAIRHGYRWWHRHRFRRYLGRQPHSAREKAGAELRIIDEQSRTGLKVVLIGVGLVRVWLLLQVPPPQIVLADFLATAGYWATLGWLMVWTWRSDRKRDRWIAQLDA